MGKHASQKPRISGLLRNTQKPIVDENVRQEKVVPLIASLKSLNADERSTALTALASLIEDINIRHMLLRERLVKIILTNILSDSSLEIVSQGYGVLRNIVLFEGRDPALYLVRENIRFSMNNISSKALSSIESNMSGLDNTQLKILDQLCENVCGLTSAILIFLGEIKGVDNVIKLGLALTNAASRNDFKLSSRCVESAFEMLYYVSENLNELLVSMASKEGIKQIKISALELNNASWATKVYGLGIECNALLLGAELEADPAPYAMQLAAYLNEVPKTETNSVQVCLELLAILSQTDDGELVSSLVSQVGSLILETLILDSNFRLQSVSVLNNIGWSLNGLQQDWQTDARKVYEATVSNCFQQLEDTELVSSALGLIGATLVQSPNLLDAMGFKDIVPRLLSRIDVLYQSKDEEWIALSRSLVLVLGSGKDAAVNLGLIDVTAKLIFSLLEHSNDVEAQIDALDALFELFGDNDASYNQTEYNEKGLNEKLEQLKPNLKRTLKSPPKSNPALREQAIDSLSNLENFIVYKRG